MIFEKRRYLRGILCCHYAVIMLSLSLFARYSMLSLCCHYAVIAFFPVYQRPKEIGLTADYSVYGENVVIYEVFYAVIMLSLCCHCRYLRGILCCHYAVIMLSLLSSQTITYIVSRYFSLEEEENQRGSGSQVVQNGTFDFQITHKSITI